MADGGEGRKLYDTNFSNDNIAGFKILHLFTFERPQKSDLGFNNATNHNRKIYFNLM